jgi:predicted DNA-binding protein
MIHHMKRTNIYLSHIQIERLQGESKKTGLSVAELIRRAIDLFFREEEEGSGVNGSGREQE